MIIDPTNPIVTESSCDYWQDELINTRILLSEINKAIQALTIGNHSRYELDSGQTRQTVSRLDLDKLTTQRNDLLSQIDDLEKKCGINGRGTIIARPYW